MPKCLQGDIFREALDSSYDVAIIFGHMGFNILNADWRNVQKRVEEWRSVHDPFQTYEGSCRKVSAMTEMWYFVSEEKYHGMSNARLIDTFEHIFDQARKDGQLRIITNGIKNVDHGSDSSVNAISDERRVRLIHSIAAGYERDGFEVTLISRDDDYTKYHADISNGSMTPAEALQQMYAARNELRKHFKGLPFTLDGRMVGDIGEAISIHQWGFKPLPAGSKTHDVQTPSGLNVQIKTTQQMQPGKQVGLGLDKRSFDHLIVIQIHEDASYVVLYDGPGSYIDAKRAGRSSPSLSVKQLGELNQIVPAPECILAPHQMTGSL